MLSASLKESREIFGTSLFSFGSAGFKNYVSAFSQRPFFVYLFNSVLASCISVVLTVLLSALAGYSFAKFRYGLAPVFWMVVLVSVMIPLEAIVIPLFLEVQRLRLDQHLCRSDPAHRLQCGRHLHLQASDGLDPGRLHRSSKD